MKSPGEWSTTRLFTTALLGLFVLAFAIHLAELHLSRDTRREAAVAPDSRHAPPRRPTVRRIGGDTVRIELGESQLSAITLRGDPERADRLADCIRDGIDRAFAAGAEADEPTPRGPGGALGWITERKRISAKLDPITDACFREVTPEPFGDLPEVEPR